MSKTISLLTKDVDGNECWLNENGEYHREDGPAIKKKDYELWFLNGKLHRFDGPAAQYYNGDKSWWLSGFKHREDGPAVEWADGYKAWFINGKKLTEQEFNERKKQINENVEKIESEQLRQFFR